MKNKSPLLNFALFIALVLLSVIIPLAYFYLYFAVLLTCVILFRVSIRRFLKKIFLYMIAGHLSVFVFFYLNECVFGVHVGLSEQAIIISNLYFRTASVILAILFYRQINNYNETLVILVRLHAPARIIQVLMISFRLIQIFYSELIVFARHFRLRIYRCGRWRYTGVMVKKLFIHFFQQTETVAHYVCLKNLNDDPETIRRLFHD